MLKRGSRPEAQAREDGQALVEFIILLPVVLAFLWYLVHVNLAINKSIVGQQAARSQLFLKMFNHRSGPMLADFALTRRSMFYIGVSGQVVAAAGSVQPIAPTEMLGIGPAPTLSPNADDDPGEAAPNSLRQRVRVRTVFGICTHRKMTPTGPTDFCAIEHGAAP